MAKSYTLSVRALMAEAEAENITSDHIVQRILDHTDVP